MAAPRIKRGIDPHATYIWDDTLKDYVAWDGMVTGIDIDFRDLVFATDKVDVSGSTVTTGGLTDAELRATPVPVSGSLTHNNAVPSSNNAGVLIALANASTPTFSEGMQVLASTDLSGRLRVQGTGPTGSAVPDVAVYNAGLNGSGNLEGVRNVGSTLNTTTGIAAAGMVAVFDDVSPTAITENQFGAVRMSSRREVYQQIRDAAGNERGLNISAFGGISADSTTLSIRMNDGATYIYVGKAAIGSATSGAVWQVQRITQADTTILWADGNSSFDNIWDNYASLSYS